MMMRVQFVRSLLPRIDDWYRRARRLVPQILSRSFANVAPTATRSATPEGRTAQQALDALDAMVGLTSVKAEVAALIAQLQLERRRRAEGMEIAAVSPHLVFAGPPGVGKTKVARAIGDILHGLGVLKKGHLVQTEGPDFIGPWIGHTAQKTLHICNKSLDGVLFIDNAYILDAQGGSNPFKPEAIETLLKFMDDNRDRLIVIVSGYPGRMKKFLASNERLASRFSTIIDFPPLSAHELCEILSDMAKNRGVYLLDGFESKVAAWVEENKAASDWGNARSALNLLEKMREAQAIRFSRGTSASAPDRITMGDVEIAIKMAGGL